MKRMFIRPNRQRRNTSGTSGDRNANAKQGSGQQSKGSSTGAAGGTHLKTRNGTGKTENEITSLKILHLLEKKKYGKVVELLRELPRTQLISCLESFPFKFLNSQLPDSFAVWETLLTKVHSNEQEYVREFPYAACDELVMKIGHFLAHLEKELVPKSSNQQLYQQCRRILKKVYMQYHEIVDRLLKENERLSKAIYSMTLHIPLGLDPSTAVSLQESIIKEVTNSASDFEGCKQALEELSIENGHILVEVAPSGDQRNDSTHQQSTSSPRSLTQKQVQERLYFNQCVLGAIKPIKRQDNLPQLTEILTTRVSGDKEVLAIFSNLRSEVPRITENDSIEPWLRKYQQSIESAITLLKEIQEELLIKPSQPSTAGPVPGGPLPDPDSSTIKPQIMIGSSPPSLPTATGNTQSSSSLEGVLPSQHPISTEPPPDRSFPKRHSFCNADRHHSRSTHQSNLVELTNKLSQSVQSVHSTEDVVQEQLEASTSVQDLPSTDQQMAGMKNKSAVGSFRSSLRHSMRKLSSSAGSVSVRKKKMLRTSSNDSVALDEAKKDLLEAHETIQLLRKRERELTDRLSEQAQRQLQDSDRFEDILMGASRPNMVMQRYQEIYSQDRVDAYDAISDIELVEPSMIPEFLLDVLKMAYEASQCNLESLHNNWKRALCDATHSTAGGDQSSTAFRQLEMAVSTYIRKVAPTHDPKDILNMVYWDLEKKYGSLPCFHIIMRLNEVSTYITEAAKLSWDLVVQNPPMVLNCKEVEFVPELHRRFHTADINSDQIVMYQWPTLIQDNTGAVLVKGFVIT